MFSHAMKPKSKSAILGSGISFPFLETTLVKCAVVFQSQNNYKRERVWSNSYSVMFSQQNLLVLIKTKLGKFQISVSLRTYTRKEETTYRSILKSAFTATMKCFESRNVIALKVLWWQQRENTSSAQTSSRDHLPIHRDDIIVEG